MSASSKSERSMSQGLDHPFPRLKTATSQDVDISKEYKSGASYKGQVQDNKKVGRGTFVWPTGAKYEGEFMDNVRHGQGSQQWPDGGTYTGDFVSDMRHGKGTHTWSNGESYAGKFFRDRRHGSGKYSWPDGSCFEGTFYLDKKEGYGVFTLADGSRFEGLYIADEREGPGICTYLDGKQDLGLWHREKLVKLCSEIPGAFSMKNYPEFEYFPEEHKTYITLDSIAENRTDVVNGIVNPPEIFQYEPKTDVSDKIDDLFSDRLNSGSLAMNIHAFEVEFYKDANSNNNNNCNVRPSTIPEDLCDADLVAVNKTPSCITMQKHILRHKRGQRGVSFDVDKILRGERDGAGGKGAIEVISEEFLTAAMEGDLTKVRSLLNRGQVYVDVADKHGHTALLGAAVNWHQDVINCLLDNGADVNKLNDEGISALAACHVHFYPVEYFKYNIAERDLERPPDVEQEQGYDVNEAVKGILTNLPPPKVKGKVASSKASTQTNIDTRKIQRLKDEYGKARRRRNTMIPEENETVGGGGKSGVESSHASKNRNVYDNRKLGTLQVKRAVRINMEDMLMADTNLPYDDENFDGDGRYDDRTTYDYDYDDDDISVASDFESVRSVRNFGIEVSDQLIERSATVLSTNDMVVSRGRSAGSKVETVGTVRRLAMDKSHHELMRSTLHLLLRRGADPNASAIPMPVLFFAIKAADVDAVKLLLSKGASTATKISNKKGGLAPLHIACAVPGEEGVQITELLLNSLADPDARATMDDSFLNTSLEDEWSKDPLDELCQQLLGGRTPLHIACARDDNYRNACRVVHLLLDHHANPNLLCNGHSPLALAVASGNDLAIDELLAYGADPCLPLSHGVGSALCIAASTEFEHRRTPTARLALIDKLIKAGADILAPIPIGPKRIVGTAVDFAYYMYNLDRRIAHMPYHALTHAERETFNARRKLLAHLGDILRIKAVERERTRMEEEEENGRRSRSPSANFVYTGAGGGLPPGIIKPGGRGRGGVMVPTDSHVSFGHAHTMEGDARQLLSVPGGVVEPPPRSFRSAMRRRQREEAARKPLFRYCYECGRSVGVRLSACTRCKEVYYCSKACKLKAWNARHKEECIRVGGRSPSPGKGDKRIDSPTPATDPDRGQPTTVAGIAVDNKVKLPPLQDTAPNIFMGRNNQEAGQSTNRNSRSKVKDPPLSNRGKAGQSGDNFYDSGNHGNDPRRGHGYRGQSRSPEGRHAGHNKVIEGRSYASKLGLVSQVTVACQ